MLVVLVIIVALQFGCKVFGVVGGFEPPTSLAAGISTSSTIPLGCPTAE